MINLPDMTFTEVCKSCSKENEVSNNINVFEVKCCGCGDWLFKDDKRPVILEEKKEPFAYVDIPGRILSRNERAEKKTADNSLKIEIEFMYGKFNSTFYTLVIRKNEQSKRLPIDEVLAKHLIDWLLLKYNEPKPEDSLSIILYN